jgi:hypothetical protein
MSYETFELRFKGCNHTMKIPLLQNQDDSRCFVVIRNCAMFPPPGNARLASALLGMKGTPEMQARDTNQGFLVRSAFAASRPPRSGSCA